MLNLALELVALCRAVPVVMDADAHDRAVALVSHTPQLVSSMVAARLEDAEETRRTAVRPGHPGRDPDRRPPTPGCGWTSSPPTPGPVADVLADVAADLDETVAGAARAAVAPTRPSARGGAAGIEDVLRRGNAGRARVPGKHGAAPAVYEIVDVLIGDQPGELARIFADAGAAGVNIEDVRIEHATGQQAGLVQLMVEPARGARARPRRCGSGAGPCGSRACGAGRGACTGAGRRVSR